MYNNVNDNPLKTVRKRAIRMREMIQIHTKTEARLKTVKTYADNGMALKGLP